LTRPHVLRAVEPVAADAKLVVGRDIGVVPAVIDELGGQARQDLLLNADVELPFPAATSPSID